VFKHQNTATGGDETAADVVMADITVDIDHMTTSKLQYSALNLASYVSSTVTNGGATETASLKLGVVGSAQDNAELSASGSINLIAGSDYINMRGTTTTEQLQFHLATAAQSIIGSDLVKLISSNGGDIWFDSDSGIIDLYHNGNQDIRLDVATTDTLKIYTGTTTLNTTFSSDDITVQGDVNSVSDERTKENIETIDNALEVVTSMRGVYYNKIGNDKRKVGVIAQEVEEVLPHVVATNTEGMKSVDYGKMVGVLIEAMKEQQEQIEALKAEIAELKQ
jgi:putative lipoic acid-binding regulatory protein